MSYPIVNTFVEACEVIEHLGILPLSSFIPDHPSLVSITQDDAWHTGMDTDPWLWRDRFAGEGVAAYGRFLTGKPILISRQIFALVKCVLSHPRRWQTVMQRVIWQDQPPKYTNVSARTTVSTLRDSEC